MSSIAQAHGEARRLLAGVDFETAARRMGLSLEGSGLGLPFFGETHWLNADGCFRSNGGAATEAVGLVLCTYVLNYPASRPAGDQRITFRELSHSGPLVSRFADNTLKIIGTTFGDREADLLSAALELGAEQVNQNGFDLFLRFEALPQVPLFLQFNAADDLFPAQAGLLFQRSAETYLDLHSLFTLGTYLTGRLITSGF